MAFDARLIVEYCSYTSILPGLGIDGNASRSTYGTINKRSCAASVEEVALKNFSRLFAKLAMLVCGVNFKFSGAKKGRR